MLLLLFSGSEQKEKGEAVKERSIQGHKEESASESGKRTDGKEEGRKKERKKGSCRVVERSSTFICMRLLPHPSFPPTLPSSWSFFADTLNRLFE